MNRRDLAAALILTASSAALSGCNPAAQAAQAAPPSAETRIPVRTVAAPPACRPPGRPALSLTDRSPAGARPGAIRPGRGRRRAALGGWASARLVTESGATGS